MIRYFLWACHSNSIIRYGWARQKNILHANAIEKPNSQRLTSLTQRFVVSKANYIILPSQKMEWKKSPHRWNFVCSSKSLWIVLRKKQMHWLYPEAICQLHVEESRSRMSFDINFARSVKPWNHEIMRFANYSRRKIQYCVNVKLIVFFSSVFNAPPNREIATKETRKNVCRVEKVSIPGEKMVRLSSYRGPDEKLAMFFWLYLQNVICKFIVSLTFVYTLRRVRKKWRKYKKTK